MSEVPLYPPRQSDVALATFSSRRKRRGSIYLSIFIYICLFIYLFISIYIYIFVYLSTYLYIYLSCKWRGTCNLLLSSASLLLLSSVQLSDVTGYELDVSDSIGLDPVAEA